MALKRKIRNYVALARPDAPGHEIYMRGGATLNVVHKRAWAAVMPAVTKAEDFKKLPKENDKARTLTTTPFRRESVSPTQGPACRFGFPAGQMRGRCSLGRRSPPG
jgi:CRISPR-associated protein Csd2